MLYGKHKLQLAKLEREAMRRAGRFNAELMDYIRRYVQAGITTLEIDRLVHEYTLKHGHVPADLGHKTLDGLARPLWDRQFWMAWSEWD